MAQTTDNNSQGTKPQASVARSTALMTVATLGSRVTGLARTWAMAFALGNTLITSAYQVANNMPNFIYELVAGGLISATFIPTYLSVRSKSGIAGAQYGAHYGAHSNPHSNANRFASNLLSTVILVLGVLAVLACVFAPQVIATQTFTILGNSEVSQMAVLFFRLFALQILLYGIGGVTSGILNAHRVFFLPSLAPAVNNIVVILSFAAYVVLQATDPNLALLVLGVGTTAGVAMQFIIQIPALLKVGFRYMPHIDLKDPALIEALKTAGPAVLYIVGMLVAFSCRNAFSLNSGDNGPATLLYAWMWFQLPFGVLMVSLNSALFTEIADAVAKGDMAGVRRYVKTGINGALTLIVPLAGLMIALSVPIIQLFRIGAFSNEDVRYVASILAIWVVALPFYSLHFFMYRVFASIRRFLLYALVSIGFVVLQCILYWLLSSPQVLGLQGIPVADIVFYVLASCVMIGILCRIVGSLGIRSVLWLALRVLLATAVGAALAWFLQGALQDVLQVALRLGEGMLSGFLNLLISGVSGLVITVALCWLLRVEELRALTTTIKRRLMRSK